MGPNFGNVADEITCAALATPRHVYVYRYLYGDSNGYSAKAPLEVVILVVKAIRYLSGTS